MANPLAAAMTWEDHQTMVGNLLNGQSIDPTLFTQYLNNARLSREQEREWKVLKKVDASTSWTSSDTWQTVKTVPTDFERWVERNAIQVWDGSTLNPSVIPVEIIPFEDRTFHSSDSYLAAIDYANNQFYMMGTADKTYTILLTYIKDNGDIVAATSNNNVSTSWVGFPARFHKILSLDVAAMWQLGPNYDDLQARQGDANAQQAEVLMKAMRKWDADLTRMSIRNLDYFPIDHPAFVNHKINTR